jgi:hypothetical protein
MHEEPIRFSVASSALSRLTCHLQSFSSPPAAPGCQAQNIPHKSRPPPLSSSVVSNTLPDHLFRATPFEWLRGPPAALFCTGPFRSYRSTPLRLFRTASFQLFCGTPSSLFRSIPSARFCGPPFQMLFCPAFQLLSTTPHRLFRTASFQFFCGTPPTCFPPRRSNCLAARCPNCFAAPVPPTSHRLIPFVLRHRVRMGGPSARASCRTCSLFSLSSSESALRAPSATYRAQSDSVAPRLAQTRRLLGVGSTPSPVVETFFCGSLHHSRRRNIIVI